MSDGIARMSKGDQVRLGRERILRSLVKCGGDEDPVRHLTVQNKYFEDYDSQLGKTEMRKLFGKAKLQDVLQEYMAKDVEISIDPDQTGVMFLKMKRPLEDAIADLPKVNTHLTLAASKETVRPGNLIPLPRPMGHNSPERRILNDGMGRRERENSEAIEQFLANLGIEQQQQQRETKGKLKKEIVPKRKNVNPILSDSEADEAEEDDDCDSETGLEENVAQLMGQRGKSNTKPRHQEEVAPNPIKVIGQRSACHAEKYLLRVKQGRAEQEVRGEQAGEAGKKKNGATVLTSSDDEEGKEEKVEQKKGEEAEDKEPADGKHGTEMNPYKRYLYIALIGTIMHVYKAITLSKLHHHLVENYADGQNFRSAFPDQETLLQFIRDNCKNVKCKKVTATEVGLIWSEESDQKMVGLLMKVGKTISHC